jgi:hypothetical protein
VGFPSLTANALLLLAGGEGVVNDGLFLEAVEPYMSSAGRNRAMMSRPEPRRLDIAVSMPRVAVAVGWILFVPHICMPFFPRCVIPASDNALPAVYPASIRRAGLLHRCASGMRDVCEAAGRRCLLLPGDWASQPHCSAIVNDSVKAFGRIDILVNNAAFRCP